MVMSEGRRLSAGGATGRGGGRGTSQGFEAKSGIPDAGTVNGTDQKLLYLEQWCPLRQLQCRLTDTCSCMGTSPHRAWDCDRDDRGKALSVELALV